MDNNLTQIPKPVPVSLCLYVSSSLSLFFQVFNPQFCNSLICVRFIVIYFLWMHWVSDLVFNVRISDPKVLYNVLYYNIMHGTDVQIPWILLAIVCKLWHFSLLIMCTASLLCNVCSWWSIVLRILAIVCTQYLILSNSLNLELN